MSVKIISERTISSRSFQTENDSGVTDYQITRETWTRNPSWLTLPTVSDTDEKFVGLIKVEKDSSFCGSTSPVVKAQGGI